MNAIDETRSRARELLARTTDFDALGLGELAANARALTRLALDLADELEAERSGRVAMQEQRDLARAVLANRAGHAAEASLAAEAER